MPICRAITALVLTLFCTVPARAADIVVGGDQSLKCFATLSGPILPGDADKLHAFLAETYSANRGGEVAGIAIPDIYTDFQLGARICLDSPGGSLAEAVRMADVLLGGRDGDEENLTGIGTAVSAGARCESACAVFFLAGGQWISSHLGRRADRVLHVAGKLGFHAPAIAVPDQNYSKNSVEKAFDTALASIAAVGERMSFLRMRHSLLQLMLDTPPSQMSYVETIGQAAEWNIQLEGVPPLRDLSAHNLVQACFNLRRAVRPDAASVVDGSTLSRVVGKHALPLEAYKHPGFPEGSFEMTEVTAGRMASLNREGDWLLFETEGHPDVDFVSCEGSLSGDVPAGDGSTSSSAGQGIAIPNWYSLPPNITFDALQAIAARDQRFDATSILEQRTSAPRDVTCRVFNGSGREIDNEPCRMEIRDTLPASLAYKRVWTFTWPSGSQTVLEAGAGWNVEDGEVNGPMAINGRRGDAVGPPEGSGIGWDDVNCIRNPGSGNTFCFDR